MIVLDASAAIDWLLQTAVGQQIDTEFTRTANRFMLRTFSTLRWRRSCGDWCAKARFWNACRSAIKDVLDLRVTRYPHFVFLPHILVASG